jgi:hypothetical protein
MGISGKLLVKTGIKPWNFKQSRSSQPKNIFSEADIVNHAANQVPRIPGCLSAVRKTRPLLPLSLQRADNAKPDIQAPGIIRMIQAAVFQVEIDRPAAP